LELDFLYRVDWKIVPNPEVLVEYYRGLVERSDGYKLESDGEDNSSEEEDSLESPNVKEDATNVKWKEWMDNVSTQNAAKQEVVDEAKEAIIKDENLDS